MMRSSPCTAIFGHIRSPLEVKKVITSHLRPCPLYKRQISTSKTLWENFTANSSSSTQIKSLEENQDMTLLDNLVNIIRERSDPSNRTTMPVRTPLLWSETVSTKTPLLSASVPLPDVMPTRNMADSYSEIVLPLGSQRQLLDQYITAAGSIRIGKLMEHLDSLAGSIAYKHVLGPGIPFVGRMEERGFFIVTAAVDRLDMLQTLNPGTIEDIRLCGHVIHTGRSSMEVVVKMEPLSRRKGAVLIGRFSMVCRDVYTQRARPVPQLHTTVPEEQSLFNMGAAFKERRKILGERSLKLVPPSNEEAGQLHQLYLNYGEMNSQRDAHTESVWMKDTALENCILMFPQERNVHGKVFGGYLMRLAYELGFSTSALFSRRNMRFLSLDGISFKHPVPIGSILRLRSKVALTAAAQEQYPALVHTTVQANVVESGTGNELTTNDFRFTWCSDNGPPLARRVVPRTYQDAMEWLEAKRVVDIGDEIRRLRNNSSK